MQRKEWIGGELQGSSDHFEYQARCSPLPVCCCADISYRELKTTDRLISTTPHPSLTHSFFSGKLKNTKCSAEMVAC